MLNDLFFYWILLCGFLSFGAIVLVCIYGVLVAVYELMDRASVRISAWRARD